jgi:hypothetical protein
MGAEGDNTHMIEISTPLFADNLTMIGRQS